MATYNEHIYAVKRLLNKGTSSDDSRTPNAWIGHYLKQARSTLIKRRLDKYHYTSQQNYSTICIPLELSNYHDCSCIPDRFDCKILKSTCSIPRELVNRWGTTYKVKYIDGRSIGETFISRNNLSEYSLSNKKKETVGWFIENDYLYILNSQKLTTVLLKFLPDNPEAVSDFCTCSGASETTGPCFDIGTSEFPIDSDLVLPMYELTLKFLGQINNFPEDNENNAKAVEVVNERE